MTNNILFDSSIVQTLKFIDHSQIENRVFNLVLSSGLGGEAIASDTVAAINEYISIAAIPSEGYLFEKWVINGIEFLSQTLALRMNQDKTVVASFLQTALVLYLNVFNDAPVNRGDRYFFGDLAKDNDVLIKNIKTAVFTGYATYIETYKTQEGQSPIYFNVFFKTNSITGNNKYVIGCKVSGDTSKGILLTVSTATIQLLISSGVAPQQVIIIGFANNLLNNVEVSWNGLIGGDIIIKFNGVESIVTATKEWIGPAAFPMRLSFSLGGGFDGIIPYAKFIGSSTFEYVLNHGQGVIIYDISGNDNHGVVANSVLNTFWGSTSDLPAPYEHTLGATLYKWNGELVTNGKFLTDIVSWKIQIEAGAEWSPLYGGSALVSVAGLLGERYIYQIIPCEIGVEYEMSADIKFVSGTNAYIQVYNAGFSFPNESSPRTSDASQFVTVSLKFTPQTTTMNVLLKVSNLPGSSAYFKNVTVKKVGFDTPTVLPICADTSYEIDKLDRLGYFPPASGILKALPNTYNITGCEPIIADGDYTAEEIAAFTPSENIDITQNDYAVTNLKVYK